MLRIAFLTDQHISTDVTNPLNIPTSEHFIVNLQVIREKKYDALILGGDLCYMEGDKNTYAWFHHHLSSLDIPFFIISGNHDNPVLISEEFLDYTIDNQQELYYKKTISNLPFFFLDTTKGYMGENQYEWLTKELSEYQDQSVWLSMHHPPVLTGSKHMDHLYAFKQMDKFQELCATFPHLTFHVFCGHCHMERTIIHQNMVVYITPSSYINIDPDIETFTPYRWQKNGFRELIWSDTGTFCTNVLYTG